MKIHGLTIWMATIAVTDAMGALVSTNDYWDVRRGTAVTANSAVHSGFAIADIFGGSASTLEPRQMVFTDAHSKGYVHWVEWQTQEAFVLTNFNLVADHDVPPYDANERGFNRFTLYVWNTGTWHQVYEFYPSNPYGGGPNYPGLYSLEVNADVTNVVGQKFRAEFVQYGDRTPSARGPRISELDGYGYELELPPPQIVDIQCGTNRLIRTSSHSAAVYDLERRSSLADGTWTNVPGASAVRGQIDSTPLIDTNVTTEPIIFYRVMQNISP